MNFARQSEHAQAPDGLPLVPSVALLTAIVSLALVGLAVDHSWTKLVRVGAAFAAYAGAVLSVRSRAGEAWRGFALAGLLIGTAHWIGLQLWRRIRRGLLA